jgi:hypothetical protein
MHAAPSTETACARETQAADTRDHCCRHTKEAPGYRDMFAWHEMPQAMPIDRRLHHHPSQPRMRKWSKMHAGRIGRGLPGRKTMSETVSVVGKVYRQSALSRGS